MPSNVVKTEKDEQRWEECKASVRKSHPGLDEDSERFNKIVMGCFERRKGKNTETKKKSPKKTFQTNADYFS